MVVSIARFLRNFQDLCEVPSLAYVQFGRICSRGFDILTSEGVFPQLLAPLAAKMYVEFEKVRKVQKFEIWSNLRFLAMPRRQCGPIKMKLGKQEYIKVQSCVAKIFRDQ